MNNKPIVIAITHTARKYNKSVKFGSTNDYSSFQRKRVFTVGGGIDVNTIHSTFSSGPNNSGGYVLRNISITEYVRQ